MRLQDIGPQILNAAHLPIIRAELDRLQIHQVLHENCPPHELARIEDADAAVAILLRALAGRVALYKIERWLEGLDLHILFGPGIEANAFNDTRLAEALDHIDDIGTDSLLSQIVSRYLQRDDAPTEYSIHQDTTSFVLQGLFDTIEEPTPRHGFSKDHRPDLKQLLFGLSLHGQDGVPLVASIKAGNTSEQAINRDHLAQLQALLPPEDEVTLVADCKLVDAITLGRILGAGLHFVSLLPNTFNQRPALIDAAWQARPDLADWPILASKPGRRKADPKRHYRGFSFTRPFSVVLDSGRSDQEPAASSEDLRFLVLHSDALAAKFERSLPGRLEREVKALVSEGKRLNRSGFACEADARQAAERAASKATLHDVSIELTVEERRVKRSRRGRPPAGETPPTKSVWTVSLHTQPSAERIEQARRRGSGFVLLTDWLEASWSDKRVLSEYRHQSVIEGSSGFRWLKGPGLVSPIFLKKPGRIRALGFLLVLALMVRNAVQFRLRGELEARDQLLEHPFTKQSIPNPTTEMALEHFSDIQSVLLWGENGEVHRVPPCLSEPAKQILSLLGFSESIFVSPPKWRGLSWERKKEPLHSATPET